MIQFCYSRLHLGIETFSNSCLRLQRMATEDMDMDRNMKKLGQPFQEFSLMLCHACENHQLIKALWLVLSDQIGLISSSVTVKEQWKRLRPLLVSSQDFSLVLTEHNEGQSCVMWFYCCVDFQNFFLEFYISIQCTSLTPYYISLNFKIKFKGEQK